MTTATSSREIPLDVSGLARSALRESVRTSVRNLGYSVAEADFWGGAFSGPRRPGPRRGTLVVGDLSRIARQYTAHSSQEWTAVVRGSHPYFVALMRTRRDERWAWLLDDLLRHSDLRMRVCRAGASSGEIQCCVAEAVSALEPDSLLDVRVPPARDRLRVEYADGLAGEVEWDRLGLDEGRRAHLILESATVGSRGKTVELLTREGGLFEIDAAAIRTVLEPGFAAAIEESARRSDASVGERVRTARRAAGLTQAALGQRIGVDQAVISRLERGRHRPRFDTLSRVAEGLGLGVGELLAG